MRTPSIFAQCLPGLLPQAHSLSAVAEKDLQLSSPAVEIVPSKNVHPYRYAGENIDLHGIKIFKGKISVADMIGLSNPENTAVSKSEVCTKFWDSSIDLVNVLKLEIRDGQLSFRGKRILELSCNYGLAGTFACLKGASVVHFQDLSAETLRCSTIPNVLANLEQARDIQSKQTESPLTPSRQSLSPDVHFFAGDWEELHTVLSVVRKDGFETLTPAMMNLSFSEEDFNDNCSSLDGSIIGHDSSRRSRKLSGSRAWERATEMDPDGGGYDVILMTDIPSSQTTFKRLYALIKKCLRPPYGIMYLATKKNLVSFSGGARQLRALVDEEGIFGVHMVTEINDREILKFFFK